MAESVLRGLRRLDHVGLQVPDLDQAEDFFCRVLGCERLYELGELRRDDDWFSENLAIHPRSVLRGLRFLRGPGGMHIELLHYQAPQPRPHPRNSDWGGHHLAFYVDDIDAAAEHLRGQGVALMGAVKSSASGPSAGQRWIYFLTPWGLQCELVSYPAGKAFEHQDHPSGERDDKSDRIL